MGFFTVCLSDLQGVAAWWKETAQNTYEFVLSRSLLLNHLEPHSSKAKILLPRMQSAPLSKQLYIYAIPSRRIWKTCWASKHPEKYYWNLWGLLSESLHLILQLLYISANTTIFELPLFNTRIWVKTFKFVSQTVAFWCPNMPNFDSSASIEAIDTLNVLSMYKQRGKKFAVHESSKMIV